VTSLRSGGLVRSQLPVPAADVGSQAAQLGAQDLLGDGPADADLSTAPPAGLPTY
jgi:hypothetical protein